MQYSPPVISGLIDELAQLVEHGSNDVRRYATVVQRLRSVVPDPATERPTLVVRTLGEFALRHGEQWLSGSSVKKGRQLIQYLVAHPRRLVSRDELIDAFWPGCASDTAAHRVHLVVSAARAMLRTVLGGLDAIRSVRGSYVWDDSLALDTDFARFLALAESSAPADWHTALELYGGEFLSGEDADWLLPMRVRCESAFVAVLERLAEDALAHGQHATAVMYGLDLIAAERGHEGAARLVMRAFAALGRRERARSIYDQLAAYLHKSLGVAPTRETTQLLHELIAGT
jgi:DNA-binding SARP family transcriptional activator